MGLFEVILLVAGGGVVWYLNYYAKEAVIKEAHREASHVKTLEAVDYELGKLDAELKRFGVLSQQNRAFMDALYSRRIDLQRDAARTSR